MTTMLLNDQSKEKNNTGIVRYAHINVSRFAKRKQITARSPGTLSQTEHTDGPLLCNPSLYPEEVISACFFFSGVAQITSGIIY